MKKMKFIFALVVFTLFSFSVNAQEKHEKRADEMVKEMVSKFAANETLKPTAEQQTALKAIYVKKLTEIKAAKEEFKDEAVQKEKVKEINKKFAKQVFDSVLTKEQKAFLKENKKSNNE